MQQSHEAGIIMGPWFADWENQPAEVKKSLPKVMHLVCDNLKTAVSLLPESLFLPNDAQPPSVLAAPPNSSYFGGFMPWIFLLWHDAFPCHSWFQAQYSHHLLNSLNGQSHRGRRGWVSEAGFGKQCFSVTHFSFPCFFSSPNQDIEARISCPPRSIAETKILSIFLAVLEDELTIRKLSEVECTVQLVQCLPSKHENPHKNAGQVVRACNSCAGKGEAGGC